VVVPTAWRCDGQSPTISAGCVVPDGLTKAESSDLQDVSESPPLKSSYPALHQLIFAPSTRSSSVTTSRIVRDDHFDSEPLLPTESSGSAAVP
jgi:hypothetical protein